ncbi:hypothetical protein [Bryobacter aggregatus]|uniref:hypothetical protein n=1 Tax=Bryobacter aggregatus TaxID=360054 RepID=UPI0004E1C4BF|nr:hypothetical protein [Bryobacter aggregatus]
MDLRLIIGRLFLALGALLVLAAFTIDAGSKPQLFGGNINLVWGIVMLAIGVVFTIASRKT